MTKLKLFRKRFECHVRLYDRQANDMKLIVCTSIYVIPLGKLRYVLIRCLHGILCHDCVQWMEHGTQSHKSKCRGNILCMIRYKLLLPFEIKRWGRSMTKLVYEKHIHTCHTWHQSFVCIFFIIVIISLSDDVTIMMMKKIVKRWKNGAHGQQMVVVWKIISFYVNI